VGKYKTTDIGFTAYLLSQGVTLLSADRVRKKTTWVFALSSADAQAFHTQWLQSPEFSFFSSYLGIKRQMRPTSGGNHKG
jgi:hypothetical protein